MHAELPRNVEAEQAYAAAWSSWLLETDSDKKRILERTMDAQQEKIAFGPRDLRWKRFIKTLPGYCEWWKNWRSEMLARLKAKPDKRIS